MKKEIPIVHAPITKAEALQRLREMRSVIEPIASNIPIIEAFDCALVEIGRCFTCSGQGKLHYDVRSGGGYKVRVDAKGKTWYLYPCEKCNGVGKVLTVRCTSCGAQSDLRTDQIYTTHCSPCETKLRRTGALR